MPAPPGWEGVWVPKARGSRSRTGRLEPGDWHHVAGPENACRACGGACELGGYRCISCAGTGEAR